jgi:hypothetical protein
VNWWSDGTHQRLDLDYLYLAQGIYWPERHAILWTVPMIAEDGAYQSTCNVIVVYDLILQAWLPPWNIAVASLCTAYHYSATAPGKIAGLGCYAGTYDGRVIRLFDGDTDNGVDIEGWFETQHLHLDLPENEKLIRNARLYGDTAGQVDFEVKVDSEDTVRSGYSKTLASLTKTGSDFTFDDVKKSFPGNFHKLKMTFDTWASLYGIELEVPAVRKEKLE